MFFSETATRSQGRSGGTGAFEGTKSGAETGARAVDTEERIGGRRKTCLRSGLMKCEV